MSITAILMFVSPVVISHAEQAFILDIPHCEEKEESVTQKELEWKLNINPGSMSSNIPVSQKKLEDSMELP
ncbi:MAG: hypothetical protein J5516_02735 [Bacteroidales bacterium]|nr:hypothetical protein [Bacteroidales bacterium]